MAASTVTVRRGIAVALAGAAVGALALSGSAAAEPVGGRPWVETPTGPVSMMSVAQQSPSVTWAGGATVVTDPDGGVSFTPTLYKRDLDAGGTWRQLPLEGASAWNSRVNDIATAADGSAFFVGDQGGDGQGVLVGRYTAGHWHLTADKGLPAGTIEASLLSVSAVSAKDAWAVGQGYIEDPFAPVPVVQHWDGKRWRSVQIPGSQDWSLNQVDEVAPDDVWVVGVDEATGQSVAVHWNGHRWKRTPTPAFADSAILFDVAARTPNDVWAVGWSRDTDKQTPAGLALHWDGTSWTEVQLPRGTFALQSVALRGKSGVVVVGGIDDGAVGLSLTSTGSWGSLGLPQNDPQLPLGVTAVAASGNRLTIVGWHYVSSEGGDSFSSGTILTR
ncbi:hypothetical protein GA0115240_18038 [Streptomyces sp. DvalAA-14]|nr:hypothetical protein GA0115240_18038 [Streptomyces sp. DvalAA-14]